MGHDASIQITLNSKAAFARAGLWEADERLLRVIDLAVDYYWEQDAEQRFTCVIPAGHAQGAPAMASWLGKTFWEVADLDSPTVPLWQEYRACFAAREPIRNFEVWVHCSRQGFRYQSISGVPRFDHLGQFVGYYGVVRDVSGEKENEGHAESLELAAIGIAHVGAGGQILHANRKLCDMLGYSLDELRARTVWDLSHPEDTHSTDQLRAELRAGRLDSFKCEKRYVRKNGSALWVGLTVAVKRDAHGRELYDVSVVEDISARKEAEARVQYLANHDELTGLPNRTLFNQLLKHALESGRRYQQRFAVLFIDLDRFKQINDCLGHDAGDVLLKEMAARFRHCVRASDLVARMGGDEFVVLVREVDHQSQIATIARNLLAAAIRPVVILGQECRVTASVGISVFPGDGNDEQSLLKHADIAMYLAKQEGKNNYQFYCSDIQSHTLEKLILESNLRHAVERCEFDLHYQAKADMSTGRIRGVEALLRWDNVTLGKVMPAQFIPVLEEMGLIISIGKWVIRRACEQIREWTQQGLPPVCVAVNLSPRQFVDPELVAFVREALEETGIEPQQLELEVTESLVIHNAERAMRKMREIKSLGVRIAIDDFGTGYSALSQLKRFPVDTLKVDRSFIRDVETVEEDRAITQAIITMGKTLGLTVVAEGVETEEQQNFLRAHACDEIQGYLFSKPLPPLEFAQLLRSHVPAPL